MSRGQLSRRLGLWDAVAIFVGIILGSGIFVAPAAVAAAAPGAAASAALWLLGGAVAACGAFCYAECGARIPRTGGFYVFYREVYGEAVAFVGGWAALLVTYPASIAAIAHIFGDYLHRAVPALPAGSPIPAALAVVSTGVVNAVGVRAGAWTQRMLTGVKVAALALLCLAALISGGAPSSGPALPTLATGSISAMLGALILVLWTYDGWSDVTLVSGELRQPGRNLGRAVVIGAGVLVLIYVAVQLSVLALLPAGRAAESSGVVAEAAQVGLGAGAGRVVAVLVVVSTLGSINGIVLTASRLGFAMAGDGVLFRWFGVIHPRLGTPVRSLAVLVGSCLFYVFFSGFQGLLRLFSFSVWIFYSLTAVALLVLRSRGTGEPVEWRAPAGWLAPAVVLATALVMAPAIAWEDPGRAGLGVAVLAVGFAVYGLRFLARRGGAGSS